jgi:hypothetical protein
MAPLSPAAQAVLDAAMKYEINPECYSREIAAAVLRAVTKRCLHKTPKGVRRYILVKDLLTIAAELEQAADYTNTTETAP